MSPWPPPGTIIVQTRGHCVGGPIILKAAGVVVLAVAGAAAYLCLWPVPAEPVSWPAQKPPGYTGAFAANTRLMKSSTACSELMLMYSWSSIRRSPSSSTATVSLQT
jgi:hypothetical protein